jgi:hypothetical protein
MSINYRRSREKEREREQKEESREQRFPIRIAPAPGQIWLQWIKCCSEKFA